MPLIDAVANAVNHISLVAHTPQGIDFTTFAKHMLAEKTQTNPLSDLKKLIQQASQYRALPMLRCGVAQLCHCQYH